MNDKYYILDGKVPKPVDSVTWARWFVAAREEGIVKREAVGGAVVSTVFIGMDCQYHGHGSPTFFETCVFSGPLHQETDRYSTWAEAEAGHAAMVERVREAEKT